MHTTGCWSDHRLVQGEFNLRIKPPCRHRISKPCPRLDTEQLRNTEPREKLQKSINDALGLIGSLQDANLTVDDSWNALKDAVYSASLYAIERVAKRHKSPGADTVPAEIYKHGGANLTNHLHQLINEDLERRECTAGFQRCHGNPNL